MKTDLQLQEFVVRERKWTPDVTWRGHRSLRRITLRWNVLHDVT